MEDWSMTFKEKFNDLVTCFMNYDELWNYKYTIPAFGALVFSSVIFYKWKTDRRPPGPYGLPILGYHFHPVTKETSERVGELSKYYNSDVISFTNMGLNFVILNSYAAAEELFQKRKNVVDRESKDHPFLQMYDEEYMGIIGTGGRYWREQRRFTLDMLRQITRNRAETIIQEEIDELLSCFSEYGGEAFDPAQDLNKAVSNVMSGIVFGHRFQYDDQEYIKSLAAMSTMIEAFSDIRILLIYFFNKLKYVFKGAYQETKSQYDVFKAFIVKQIQEHSDNYDGTVNDFVDGFLKEIEDGQEPQIFNDAGLRSLISDLFIFGSEMTAPTLRWCLLFMAAYPEIQNKVYNEIQSVIKNGPVNFADKDATPYTEAVLNEIQRYRTLLPVGIGRCNLDEDIEINGYVLPKGSMICANLQYLHRDEKVWKTPNAFDPGNFYRNGRVINSDKLIQFSIGHRSCVGESLAKMELYIFFVSILREMELKRETDETVADLEPVVAAGDMFQAKPYKLRMIKRK